MQLEQTLSKINIRYTPKITEFDKREVEPQHKASRRSFWVGAFIAFFVFAFTNLSSSDISDELLFLIILPLFMALGGAICYGISWLVVNEMNKSEMRKRKLELAQKNERIKKGNERNTLSANKKNKIISSSVSKLKSAIVNTQTELDNLYSSNFIYPKYRNLIAVASMYEYIDSGRCNELEGADGAYNIYELEVRLDRIITQLDIIISNLEQIKANQYYLYTAINNLKPQIDNVVNEIKENTKKLDAVAVNTAITAYTAQVI